MSSFAFTLATQSGSSSAPLILFVLLKYAFRPELAQRPGPSSTVAFGGPLTRGGTTAACLLRQSGECLSTGVAEDA